MLTSLFAKSSITKAREVIAEAFDTYDVSSLAVAWTGGKDSTLLLWLIKDYCEEHALALPPAVFIDEGDTFPEVVKFVQQYSKEWGVDTTYVKNADVLTYAKQVGDKVDLTKLNKRNKKELARLGVSDTTFYFEPESYVGNHLLKTVPFSEYIESHDIEAVFVGIRKDENEARGDESYFSSRTEPKHTRIHPILDFSEKDVWEQINALEVPYVSLYKKGYRSLGAKSSTDKTDDRPAWEQLDGTSSERAGRRQDKEKIMSRLRKLGYM